MAKLILGLGALVLYGSFGMASGVADVRPESPASSLTSTEADPREPEIREGAAVRTGGISEEERERRVQECETLFEACRDWCTRGKLGRQCYAECSAKLGDCMKKIPYAD
ncbi:hypothetical protein [Polyangium sorediatum]|uniref:Uncharacterized protein n=1 Tax=Polyangium sorediatum TaxID=889274 RepID=A0ABT6NXZ5_9BACT|nr:hypothetical protein [Polyangium sorediatum]MDI1433225.1 hypothetical protein [Polyangium sorediatum]